MTSGRPTDSLMTTVPSVEARPSPHPRRPPANQSVSLLHRRVARAKDPGGLLSDSGKKPQLSRGSSDVDSPSGLQLSGGRNRSGQSSNVEEWFEKSNNEVRDNSASFADNDPPFFLRNPSSYETPPDAQCPPSENLLNNDEHTNTLPLRTGLLQLGTDGSSTEDFRSVIDDLTVENKKLKRRLKKYEQLQDSHLKDEKLFEVRIHGLQPEKKRELEETLRKFASSLGTTGANSLFSNRYASLPPMLKTRKTADSLTSIQHADSAYASMSASGQGSSAQSGNDSNHKLTPTNYLASRSQNVHSYLNHIPEGLLPQQNVGSMSERAKKRHVVRKMEQLLDGNGAVVDVPQRSYQQQEVFQSAAGIDRSVLETTGQLARQEGKREAHIMGRETEDSLDLGQAGEKPSVDKPTMQTNPEKKMADNQDFGKHSPEQRPTRPLDLDPHCARVPAENLRYMRRMGFLPPEPDSSKSPEEGHGWIYLNFLINMAQLHTINVTPDFVRKALGEYSNKFEVSRDGRKVRWNRSNFPTQTSSGRRRSLGDGAGDATPDGQSPCKRPKLSHMDSVRSGVTGAISHNKHVYTPMFVHKDSADETDDSSSEEDNSMCSPLPALIGGDSLEMVTYGPRGFRTTSGIPNAQAQRRQKPDDGPIIFYNNARFCTDLSGDKRPNGNYRAPIYTPASSVPIGQHLNPSQSAFEKRGPLAGASELPEPVDLDDNPIPESTELLFPPRSPSKTEPLEEQSPIELEVSGIGGVLPIDNFAISVQSRVERQQVPDTSAESAPMSTPHRFTQVLRGHNREKTTRAAIHNQVVVSKVKDLPPSELPPPLAFIPSQDELLSDSDSDVEDDTLEVPESPDALPPAAAPQPVDIPYSLSEDEDDDEDDEDEDEDESDGEVDFLAAARQIDPEAVRQQEREYDANMADRLAEELPAGSSAATAGGGSGFASPASNVDKEEHRRAMREARARKPPLKRARTNDSMVVQAMQDSSDGDSSDDYDDDEMSDARS